MKAPWYPVFVCKKGLKQQLFTALTLIQYINMLLSDFYKSNQKVSSCELDYKLTFLDKAIFWLILVYQKHLNKATLKTED